MLLPGSFRPVGGAIVSTRVVGIEAGFLTGIDEVGIDYFQRLVRSAVFAYELGVGQDVLARAAIDDAALRRVVLAELEAIAAREKAIFIKNDPDVVKSWGLEPERPSPIGSKFVTEVLRLIWAALR